METITYLSEHAGGLGAIIWAVAAIIHQLKGEIDKATYNVLWVIALLLV